ncbi:hypothetical protein PMAYCL1PPCAC_30900, partial [Pristionchus mayeri]
NGEMRGTEREETGLVLIRSLQSGMGFLCLSISSDLSDRGIINWPGNKQTSLLENNIDCRVSATLGRRNTISRRVTMNLLLLLLLLPSIVPTVLERSHRKALLTFEEWDLNKDCFVTYDEFINYFLDMLFAIRMFEAKASATERRHRYLREEDFEVAAGYATADRSKLNDMVCDERMTSIWSQFQPLQTVSTVFKIKSVINTTFWHRP